MSIALLLRLLPFLAAAGAGGFAWHEVDTIRYTRLQAQYSAYQTQVAQEHTQAEKAAREAEEDQEQQRSIVEVNNGRVMQELQHQLADTQSDLFFARRLLNAQSKAGSPTSTQLPETSDRQTAPGASPASGRPSLETLAAAAIGECEHNADQLDALIKELTPQL